MAGTFDLFPWFKNFAISPATDWQRFINPQFNFTINENDARVENHVLASAGSYGKQLGRMQEVIDVLLEHVQLGTISAVERRSLDKYGETRGKVESAVKEGKVAEDGGAFDRWLDELARLRDKEPPRFEEYARRLEELLRRRSAEPGKP